MATNDPRRFRVLFLCTGNSARSQMAEAFLKHFGGDRFEVYSAGTQPRPIHPGAIDAMADIGIDISRHTSDHVDDYAGLDFDFIITLCDKANEECPSFPGDPVRLAWSFEDPAETADSRVFARVAREISERVKIFALVQSKPRPGA